jgi:DNA polymerase III epsilon subunit-like protein
MAFLILTRIEPDIYVLSKSLNLYVNQGQPLSSFFTRYTHITDDFLCDNGVDLSVARTEVMNTLLDINPDTTMIVSHGLKNDLDILTSNGINLKHNKTHFCTYNMAKKYLKRNERLSLKDVAVEGGYYMFNEHNAYADVWGTLYAFCFLKERI